MARKKNRYHARAFESKGDKYQDINGTIKADTSANIYESMLTSQAYLDLKTRQKMLYVLCKAQYYGKRKPGKDYQDIEQLQDAEMFYLNLAAVTRYGIYTSNMRKEFYGDMQKLVENGFIKLISRGGGNGKAKSIWQFSSNWRTWEPPQNNDN